MNVQYLFRSVHTVTDALEDVVTVCMVHLSFRSDIYSLSYIFNIQKGQKKMPKIEEKCMKLLELLGRDDFVALMLYVFYGSVDLCWIKYK